MNIAREWTFAFTSTTMIIIRNIMNQRLTDYVGFFI